MLVDVQGVPLTAPTDEHGPDQWHLLDTDPVTGIQSWYYYDSATDNEYVCETQDVAPLLDFTHEQRANTDERAKFGDMARIAQVPMHLMMDGPYGNMLKDPDALRRFVNDRNMQKFRTRSGRM